MALVVETPTGDTEIELVKVGKRLYGAFHTHRTGPLVGRKVYVAYRKHGDIYRGGEATISDAMRSGRAAWALDEETVLAARARGCFAIAILERDTGDRWASLTDAWFDKGKRKWHDYSKKGGSKQILLPLKEFRFVPGEIKL